MEVWESSKIGMLTGSLDGSSQPSPMLSTIKGSREIGDVLHRHLLFSFPLHDLLCLFRVKQVLETDWNCDGQLPQTVLQTYLVVPGSRINNGVCTYHILQVTRAREEIRRHGSPEHRVLKTVHNPARMTKKMLEAVEMEGLQRCHDSGEVDFVEGYARLTRPFWPVDETQEALRKIGRNWERPNNATLHHLMDRGLVDASLEFRGNLLYNNSTTAFRFVLPDSRGVSVNLP
ncbi:hypothetical protein CAEBREN_05841 [Caenorhabditis brenneri]|uniref:Uncharacterized protein n=1 Tax=Caenorhabditis brenneri TaxID=135651 RepID=G0MWL1_CAEBE|nr:hypothetical protein CAEBREN_05841 [Caenorhabditis brenneri]